jgi:hypothetical protein
MIILIPIFIIIIVITLVVLWYFLNLEDVITQFSESVDNNLEKCKFMATDIINGFTYKKSGKEVNDPDTQIDCKDCGEYIYKTNGECSRYSRETRLLAENNYLQVCTSLEYPKSCDLYFVKNQPEN